MGKKNIAAAAVIDAPQIDIGIKSKDREKIALGLSRVLADTYSLYLKTHNFHWNVEGPMFNTLHLMFMDRVHRAVERARCDGRTHPLAGLPGARHRQGIREAHVHRRNRGRARSAGHGSPAGLAATRPWRAPHAPPSPPPRRPAMNPPATC